MEDENTFIIEIKKKKPSWKKNKSTGTLMVSNFQLTFENTNERVLDISLRN
jgi:hypothetical protein